MRERRLRDAELERLRTSDLTYVEVGGTRADLPSGYHHLQRTVVLGHGSACFEQAARRLSGWEMHRRAGLSVRASDDVVVEGTVAIVRLGWGVVAVDAPVRVVYVVAGPRRQGFAYGTLPGHPESGEEAFVLEHHEDDEVTFTISAFSRPASRLARATGPAGRMTQRWVTHRYLRALTT